MYYNTLKTINEWKNLHYSLTVGNINAVTYYPSVTNIPAVVFNYLEIETTGLNFDFVNIIPGSFNPLHEGHKAIFSTVSRLYKTKGTNPIFELCICPKDKSRLLVTELKERLEQFTSPVIITNQPLLAQKNYEIKSNLQCIKKDCNFHIGADNLVRLLHTYSIESIREWDFIVTVYPRQDIIEQIISRYKPELTVEWENLPYDHQLSLFDNIYIHKWKVDDRILNLSSSQIREGSNNV